MARCFYCGEESGPHSGITTVCPPCSEKSQRLALAASNLAKARAEMRSALDEVSRLKDFYVAMPKPSSDGATAIMLAQRVYARANVELVRALQEFHAALERPGN